MTGGRYRWRTAVRRHTPWWLIERGVVERCYHCLVGERPHDPAHVPAPEDDGQRRAR